MKPVALLNAGEAVSAEASWTSLFVMCAANPIARGVDK